MFRNAKNHEALPANQQLQKEKEQEAQETNNRTKNLATCCFFSSVIRFLSSLFYVVQLGDPRFPVSLSFLYYKTLTLLPHSLRSALRVFYTPAWLQCCLCSGWLSCSFISPSWYLSYSFTVICLNKTSCYFLMPMLWISQYCMSHEI